MVSIYCGQRLPERLNHLSGMDGKCLRLRKMARHFIVRIVRIHRADLRSIGTPCFRMLGRIGPNSDYCLSDRYGICCPTFCVVNTLTKLHHWLCNMGN